MEKNVRHGRCFSIRGLCLDPCLINGIVRWMCSHIRNRADHFPGACWDSGLACRLRETWVIRRLAAAHD